MIGRRLGSCDPNRIRTGVTAVRG
ncbi:MAG: hypothetical protein JWP75_4041, partial [Frondihabitans sp.]|nr:hypothetical protein [Frondihabitans sp.]